MCSSNWVTFAASCAKVVLASLQAPKVTKARKILPVIFDARFTKPVRRAAASICSAAKNSVSPKFPPLKRGYLFDITTIQGKENFRLLATLCPGVGAPDVGGEWVP